MVITGGENVYPVEVEALLADHPAIAEVAVIGTPDVKWGEAVTAAVVVKPGVATPSQLAVLLEFRLVAGRLPRLPCEGRVTVPSLGRWASHPASPIPPSLLHRCGESQRD
jgi:acyl-coenzyme A synthetase/AMP-(fatty) acid ligase